ncbi:MAG: hypothetical protein COB17_05470 [Sulfurimonas sp.]|nr:MAG: hypothetical protein COB17_05470 [Sulfurimonas sp.]
MTQISSKGIQDSLVQEAIFAASAAVHQVLSGAWDENSIEPGGLISTSRVINLMNNDCDEKTKRRPGHINQTRHRRCLDDNTTTALNTAGGTTDDLNDEAKAISSSIYSSFTSAADGYKQDFNSTITVENLAAVAGAKLITVNISLSSGAKPVTVLRAYSYNIGEISYHRQSY